MPIPENRMDLARMLIDAGRELASDGVFSETDSPADTPWGTWNDLPKLIERAGEALAASQAEIQKLKHPTTFIEDGNKTYISAEAIMAVRWE
jgi:hypothetical protein